MAIGSKGGMAIAEMPQINAQIIATIATGLATRVTRASLGSAPAQMGQQAG